MVPMKFQTTPAALKPCLFHFGDLGPYEGFADGTKWGGWDNVAVSLAVLHLINADLSRVGREGIVGRPEAGGLVDLSECIPSRVIEGAPPILGVPIVRTDIKSARAFLLWLNSSRYQFHIDEDPSESIGSVTGELAFHPMVSTLLRQRVKECFAVLGYLGAWEAYSLDFSIRIIPARDGLSAPATTLWSDFIGCSHDVFTDEEAMEIKQALLEGKPASIDMGATGKFTITRVV